ncbi:MAG: MFS transporter [Verrucomicrobia bacterium]|nr:MFS transporter [Verrucomicrobiota bacterium]
MTNPSPTGSTPAPAPTLVSEKTWRNGTLVYNRAELVTLFCWLLWGDFALSLKDRSIPSLVQLQLQKLEASDTLSGLLIGSLPAVIGLLVLPVVGYRSDRHRGPRGRRIPYLLSFSMLAVVSMVGLAASPPLGQWLHVTLGAHSPGLANGTLIFFSASWTLFEFASIVLAGSLITAFINDVVPHSLLGRFYGLFRALSLIAGAAFNYWGLSWAENHLAAVFLGMAVLYGLGFTVMCFKVREGEYPPPPAPEEENRPSGAVLTYLRESFSQSYYWWVFLAIMVSWMALVPFTLFSVFYAKSVQMDMATYGKLWSLTYLCSLVLAYPLGMLADKIHPLRLSAWLMLCYAIATLWAGFFAIDARSFGIALVVQGVLSGGWQTASASLAQRLFPESRFAQLASAMGIVGGVTGIGLPLLVGKILDHSGHVYRYTFLMNSALSFLALAFTLVLWRRFRALGGPQHYVAP